MSQTLLVSLHDVSPVHAPLLERAERLFARLGVPAVTYLLVPDFHRRAPIESDGAFIEWCRAERPYAVEWFLHGLVHEDEPGRKSALVDRTFAARIARRFLTAGEGEFLDLRGPELATRLDAGVRTFTRALDAPPRGFVAPAWLYNDELLPALARAGVRFTESHFHVFDVTAGRVTASPVITWATRSRLHRAGSRTAAAAGRRFFQRAPVLRLALHPADLEHQTIVDSISRTIDVVRRRRRVMTYAEFHDA